MPLRFTIRLKGLLWFAALLWVLFAGQAYADQAYDLENLLADWIEQNPEADGEVLAQELAEWIDQPLNLNDAQRKHLESLPFLSPEQKDNLAYFLYRNQPLSHPRELLLCEGIDEISYRRISPLVYVGACSKQQTVKLKQMLSGGKHEIRMYAASGFQLKEGLANAKDSALRAAGKAYVGLPFSSVSKYRYRYGRQLQYGFVVENDLGEKPADFVSFHLALNDLAKINSLILGDYRVTLGRGLLVSSGFSSGKATSLTALSSTPKLLSSHFSSSETGFFRGVAIDLSLSEQLQLLMYVSSRKLDALITEGSFSSVRTDGLHRTLNELRARQTLRQHSGGLRLAWNSTFFHIGANLLYYRFNALCNPELKPYSLDYFRGTQNLNASLDYRFRLGGALFGGECAWDKNLATANYHQLQYQLHPLLSMIHSFRYYSPAYQAFFAAAFSENSRICNEIGGFTCLEYRLFQGVKLDAYMDIFVFPRLKYGVHAPSSGHELGLEITSYTNQGFEWGLRYREKSKSSNLVSKASKGIYTCTDNVKQQLRLQWMLQCGRLRFKTKADINTYFVADPAEKTRGTLFAQECRYSAADQRLVVSLQYAMFDARSYDNRIYHYENDLPGVFSIPAYSGTGSAYVLNCSLQAFRNAKCWFRIKHRNYSDRQEVGSLLDVVQGNCSSEFRVGFQYQFAAKRKGNSQNQQ